MPIANCHRSVAGHFAQLARQLSAELAGSVSTAQLRDALSDALRPVATDESAWATVKPAEAISQLLVYVQFRAQARAYRGVALEHPSLLDQLAIRLGALAPGTYRHLQAAAGQLELAATLDQLRRDYTTPYPELYFYEALMRHCDAGLRQARGVYLTPQPIVSYLVGAVEHLLSTHFSCSRSAAHPSPWRLQVLDPACGTGLFLLAALERASRLMPDSAPHALDLLGVDVQPVCCAIAHDALEQCDRKRVSPPGHRWRVVASNVLEKDGLATSLLDKQLAPNRLPIVIGNPPYSNFGRLNRNAWLDELLQSYKRGLCERKVNLQDDFVKFLRLGQYWIERAGAGILAFITSRTYLQGLTHRAMRENLRDAFSEIYLLDLHGAQLQRRGKTGDSDDQNVFPIRQGVSLGIFVKQQPHHGPAQVCYHALQGSRHSKLSFLSQTDFAKTPWQQVEPQPPRSLFYPHVEGPPDSYHSGPRLDEIFQHYISGVQTKRDALWTDMDRQRLSDRMKDLLRTNHTEKKLACRSVAFEPAQVIPYTVAPFDRRWVYYEPALLGRPRYSVMRHMTRDNIGLVFMRQSTNDGLYDHFLAVDTPVTDRVLFSARGAPFLAPLYLHEPHSPRLNNISNQLLKEVAARLGRKTVTARALLDYAYGIFHSPGFRSRYGQQLRVDFPRLPLTANVALFKRISRLGRKLIDLHLSLAPVHQAHQSAAGRHTGAVVAAGYPRFESQRLYLSRHWVLSEVPESAWQFRIGGYCVLQRWLKQRRHLTLTSVDLAYLHHLVAVTCKTIELMRRLDAAIPRWPV